MSREVVADTPRHVTQQAAPVTCPPHLLSAVFSTTPVLTVLHLIMTETGIWDGLVYEACGRSIEVNSEVK